MTTKRRFYEDQANLLPWERTPADADTGSSREIHETERKPTLYLPDGTALTKRRPLGFRPEDAKR